MRSSANASRSGSKCNERRAAHICCCRPGPERSMVRSGRYLNDGIPVWSATMLVSTCAQRLKTPHFLMLSRLSYRDLVGMMAERGVMVAQSTILRWVTRYVPEYEKRWNRFSRPVSTSWRTDETYISIRGKWHYLYRAVDKQGKTVDFLLRRDRGIAAAQAFFRKALATNLNRWPRQVTLDGHLPSHRSLRLLRREDPMWRI